MAKTLQEELQESYLQMKGVLSEEDNKIISDILALDELSKKTLGSYIRKASINSTNNAHEAGKSEGNDFKRSNHYFGKAKKRIKGITAATKRLTKEQKETIEDILEELENDENSMIEESSMDRVSGAEGTKVKVHSPKLSHHGKSGVVVDSGKDGSFHVVKFKDGKSHSFQGSDLRKLDESEELEEDVELTDSELLEGILAITELSKKTLGSYIKKASNSAAFDARDIGNITGLKKRTEAGKLIGVRLRNIGKATDKLTKEEVERIEAKLETLDESKEYSFLKSQGFKLQGKMSDGSDAHVHPSKGTVLINKHGHWHHVPHGSTREDGFEGSVGSSLITHLAKVKG